MKRYTKNMILSKTYYLDQIFSGNDSRIGFDTKFSIKNFNFQTEIILAKLNNEKSSAYYFQADFNFFQNSFALIYDSFHNSEIGTNIVLGATYNRYFENKKIRLSLSQYYYQNNKKNLSLIQF